MNIYELILDVMDFFVLPQSIVILAGLVMFGNWLLRTSLGKKALSGSVERRNNMAPFIPFVPFVVYFGLSYPVLWMADLATASAEDWQRKLVEHIAGGILITATIGLIIFLARRNFARGLKGFGIDTRTIGRDLGAALINLLTIWPLVLFVVIMTSFAGKLIYGPDFEIEQHQELQLLSDFSQMPVLVAVFITTVILGPVFEEMVFRGLFQTLFRSFTAKPWGVIVLSSILFVIPHSNQQHWPGLFVLSMAMGYSYEKSGSLFRPILIHALFNATSVIITFLQVVKQA